MVSGLFATGSAHAHTCTSINATTPMASAVLTIWPLRWFTAYKRQLNMSEFFIRYLWHIHTCAGQTMTDHYPSCAKGQLWRVVIVLTSGGWPEKAVARYVTCQICYNQWQCENCCTVANYWIKNWVRKARFLNCRIIIWIFEIINLWNSTCLKFENLIFKNLDILNFEMVNSNLIWIRKLTTSILWLGCISETSMYTYLKYMVLFEIAL